MLSYFIKILVVTYSGYNQSQQTSREPDHGQDRECRGQAAQTLFQSAEDDRRKTLVSLTAAGREKTQQHVQQAMRHQTEVLKPLTARESAMLIQVLRKIILLPGAA